MLKKLMVFTLFLLLIKAFLFAEDLNKAYQATLESEPSAVVEGCVNAITGNFYLNDIDIIAYGKESTYYKKNYINILSKVLNTPENRNSITPYEFHRLIRGGWEYFSHIVAYIDYDNRDEQKYRRLDIYEPSGVFLSYNINDPDKKKNESKAEYKQRKNRPRKLNLHVSQNSRSRSFVNTSKGMISARTNYVNNVVEKIGNNDLKIFHVDGSIRLYNRQNLISDNDPYFLDYEILPNGNKIKYEYDIINKHKSKEIQLVKIRTLSPTGKEYSSIKIDNICEEIKLDKKKKSKVIKTFVHTNTGKHLEYRCPMESSDHDYKNFILKSIKSCYGEDNIEYYPHFTFFLSRYIFPKNKPFCIDYYLENCEDKIGYKKVSRIRAPLGNNKDSSLYTAYSFDYETSDVTKVYDAYNNETKYLYEKDTLRLKEIQRYENGKSSFVNKEKFVWGKDSQDGFLLGKIFYNEANQPVKAVVNQYDPENKGNIIKKIIYGDISKNGSTINLASNELPIDNVEKQVTQYFYFPNNLLSEKKDQNGLSIKYTYHACQIDNQPFQTDLPSTKFVIFNDEIKQRTFYEYDTDNVLIKEITDDGSSHDVNNLLKVTKRVIKKIIPRNAEPYGLTDILEEYYLDFETGLEKLLQKTKYEYSKACKVTAQNIYGSDDQYKYTLHYAYDEKDNLIEQTDPLGRIAKYKYDESNNKIYEQTFEGKEIFYNYDTCNRLTSKTIKNENEDYVEEYEYDLKHNKSMQRDIYGNEIYFKYNAFNQLIKEIHPLVEDENGNLVNPVLEYAYDSLGNQILKKDAKGNIITTSCNIFGKPTKITYPNNTKETFLYDLDNNLLEYTNQKGTKTLYEYDYLKRVLSKIIMSSDGKDIRKEFFEYDAFNLISKTDTDGNITKYTYDGASRKIKEELFSKNNELLSVKEIFYDELGFIKKKIKGNSLVITYTRDFLGRVLEKTKEDLCGKILFRKSFTYDKSGKKKTIISYIANGKSEEIHYFDVFNRLINSVDALGNVSKVHYPFEQNQKKKIIISENAIRQKTIKTYDSLGREIKIEEINPQGLLISLEEKFYDLNGNLSRQRSSIYDLSTFKFIKTVENYYAYDQMNQLILLKEACNSKEEKTTHYSYTITGDLQTTTKPDGTELINDYDSFGNKTRYYSSIRDIDYQFVYNNLNQLIEAKDNIRNEKILRKYDALGNLLQENQITGLTIQNNYDLFGNRTSCFIKDNNNQNNINIEYIYDPLNLKKVMKKDLLGNVLYKHEFLDYDLYNNLLKEKLNNGKEIKYILDKLGRKISIDINYHNQKIIYDSIGRIINIKWEKFQEDNISFEYDDLNQIIKEGGLFINDYQYDSNYNRLKKNDHTYEINSLNQLLSSGEGFYIYDKNGNPIQQTTQNYKINYFYDSLDRLIKIEKENSYILEFSYDPFNRRISKKFLKYSDFFGWQEKDFKNFLYDDQNEIGSFDQNLNQKELRILSDTENAEIGSGIFFEIDGYLYEPIYDVSGNVVSLIYKDSLYEHYRYSVFGERKDYCNSILYGITNNPWKYSSKRIDEESNLVYYGRRYYDPAIGRWLTCDPSGFNDGLNLYAFVLNDPLIKYDLYGLYANPWMFPKAPSWTNDAAGAVFHRTANFGVDTVNFMTDLAFGVATPFLYSYRKLTGGNFANDYQVHLQNKARLIFDVHPENKGNIIKKIIYGLFFPKLYNNLNHVKIIFILILVIFLSFYYKFLFFYTEKTRKTFLNEIKEYADMQNQNRYRYIVEKKYLEMLHAQGKKFIEHFSDLKMRYKNLPIIILTALFIAAAYIIGSQENLFSSKEEQNFIHEHMLYLISLITIMSVIGIKMIRYLDINVSHEQIRSLFKCMIDLEKKYKVLI